MKGAYKAARQTQPRVVVAQGRDLASFDHVKRDLKLAVEEEPSAIKGLHKQSEDAQRILARLNTQEAAEVLRPLTLLFAMLFVHTRAGVPCCKQHRLNRCKRCAVGSQGAAQAERGRAAHPGASEHPGGR